MGTEIRLLLATYAICNYRHLIGDQRQPLYQSLMHKIQSICSERNKTRLSKRQQHYLMGLFKT